MFDYSAQVIQFDLFGNQTCKDTNQHFPKKH